MTFHDHMNPVNAVAYQLPQTKCFAYTSENFLNKSIIPFTEPFMYSHMVWIDEESFFSICREKTRKYIDEFMS